MKINIPIPNTCIQIMQDLKEKGHLSLIVGGSVRDALLGQPSKDIDIEVYGTNYNNLVKMLKEYGEINLVGKAFGVVKLKDKNEQDYDFSVPRKDSKIENDPKQIGEQGGNRGRGIKSEFDPNITPKEASSRRDFTFNSIGYNPLTNEVYDYFGGFNDIENKIMRATSSQFSEDPLRVLRGFQLISRLGFKAEPKTIEMAKSLKKEPLVKERESEEWMKFFTKGKYFKESLQYLIDTEWIERYPELNAIVDVEQDKIYHPEGNNFSHLVHSLNAASNICLRKNIIEDDKVVIIASVLGHDLGKAETTKEETVRGIQRITSKGHANLSGPLTKSLLERIGIKSDIVNKAIKLAKYHMFHLDYKPKSKKANVRQLAENLYPATVKELMFVIEADHSGRPPLEGGLPEKAQQIKKDAFQEKVYKGKVPSLILGRDILYLFDKPGPLIGQTLEYVRNKQLSNQIHTKEQAINSAETFLKSRLLPISGKDVLEVLGGTGGPYIGEVLNKAWEAFKNGETIDKNWIKKLNKI